MTDYTKVELLKVWCEWQLLKENEGVDDYGAGFDAACKFINFILTK